MCKDYEGKEGVTPPQLRAFIRKNGTDMELVNQTIATRKEITTRKEKGSRLPPPKKGKDIQRERRQNPKGKEAVVNQPTPKVSFLSHRGLTKKDNRCLI